MANSKLAEVKRAKNDEFYTQYADIETEISTYLKYDSDVFRDKTILKIFILTNDKTGDRKIDMDDLEWRYLTDDGDFRSAEITKLRDADERNQSSGKSNCPLYAVGMT